MKLYFDSFDLDQFYETQSDEAYGVAFNLTLDIEYLREENAKLEAKLKHLENKNKKSEPNHLAGKQKEFG